MSPFLLVEILVLIVFVIRGAWSDGERGEARDERRLEPLTLFLDEREGADGRDVAAFHQGDGRLPPASDVRQ